MIKILSGIYKTTLTLNSRLRKTKSDITSFVRAQSLVQRRKLLHLSNSKAELKEIIIEQVTEGANGMSVLS